MDRLFYMKKGQVYEGKVLRLDFPNKGIVELDDKRVTVKNTIPGQSIRFGKEITGPYSRES